MNTPEENEVLTAEGVKLLVKGDLLRCVKGSDETPAIATGEVVTFVKPSNSGGVSNCIVTSADETFGYRPGRFIFIGRPDSEGWLPWGGGENPVPGGEVVECKRRDCQIVAKAARKFDWLHSPRRNDPADIIAFRLSPPKDDETVSGRSVAPLTPEQINEIIDGREETSPEGSVPTEQVEEPAGHSTMPDLREALRRISALTPAAANAESARDLHLTVKAIADTALSHPVAAEGEGAGLRAWLVEERNHDGVVRSVYATVSPDRPYSGPRGVDTIEVTALYTSPPNRKTE